MKRAAEPFRFFTASYVTRIGAQKAANLRELGEGLEHCSDNSIFHHTYQTLEMHHFLTERFSNDFAQWVLAAMNRAALAEQLGGIDIRDYVSLAELRADLTRAVRDYCKARPADSEQAALEPFYFCESIEVTVPLEREAWTLEAFREGLESLSHASIYYHFISSRLRLHLRTNDFSLWFTDNLELPDLAHRANRIDIYTNTLDTTKARLLALVDRQLNS